MRMRNDIAADVAKGIVAGIAATWVMDRVTTAWYERQDARVTRKEERVRGGNTAFVSAAKKIADALNIRLSQRQQQRAGTAVHWLLGADAGVGYALARRRLKAAGKLKGLGYGAMYWVTVDEILNPLLGFTKGPASFPWQTHARGLAGHLAFGLTVHTTLAALDRIT